MQLLFYNVFSFKVIVAKAHCELSKSLSVEDLPQAPLGELTALSRSPYWDYRHRFVASVGEGKGKKS